MPMQKFQMITCQNCQEFINFWGNYYVDNVPDIDIDTGEVLQPKIPINYIEQLNLEGNLDRGNIIRLLRWKYLVLIF